MEYRFINETDNLEGIGELLFITDPYIYPNYFGNVENAEIVINEAIRRSLYCFKYENIFCAFNDNKPVAFLVTNKNGQNKWIKEDWDLLLNELDIEKTYYSKVVEDNYFLAMNEEELRNSTYILAVSVLEEYRGRGIASTILEEYMKSCDDTLVLDCLEDNTIAIHLYKKFGFKVIEHYIGFNVSEPYPKCVRMMKSR